MGFLSSTLLLLAPLTLALPTLAPRAGAPAIVPIPANCTQTAILPALSNSTNFTLTPTFLSAAQVYSVLYTPGEGSLNESALFAQCLEQCYGFGNSGDCVAVLRAEQVTELAYGTEQTGWGCLFLSRNVTQADLVATTDGSFANAQVLNRWCPSPRADD